MAAHRDIVAWGFTIGGAALAVPSAVGLVAVVWAMFSAPTTPENKGEYLDVGTYGIAGLLANGAKGVGALFDWMGGVAAWVEGVLAGVLGAALLFAILLFFTGRGIARHASGAGTLGIVLSVIFALVWAAILLSVNRNAAMAVPALGLAAALYAIWVLGWK